ncbi:hypothetical protein CCMA1212_007465 [Trichoderma ghanense]|uniref:NADH-ubiquinone oxidoreductase 9.5 kDa subunit n=1 Tax=Trichoderma ghanense TaxID=65468 RepID=A0ABY2GZS4_9HYPO
MSAPLFWSTPLKYCSWAARERPAFFWSVVVGATGPLLMPIVPPIRHMLGDVDPAPIPVTYPGTFDIHFSISNEVNRARQADTDMEFYAGGYMAWRFKTDNWCIVPAGPRKQLTGYDDE